MAVAGEVVGEDAFAVSYDQCVGVLSFSVKPRLREARKSLILMLRGVFPPVPREARGCFPLDGVRIGVEHTSIKSGTAPTSDLLYRQEVWLAAHHPLVLPRRKLQLRGGALGRVEGQVVRDERRLAGSRLRQGGVKKGR